MDNNWYQAILDHFLGSPSITMASTSIKRKSSDSCWLFNEKWTNVYFYVPIIAKPACLICHEAVSVSKEYNIERHYETKHASNLDHLQGQLHVDKVNRLQSDLKCQQNLFKRLREESEACVKVSCHS